MKYTETDNLVVMNNNICWPLQSMEENCTNTLYVRQNAIDLFDLLTRTTPEKKFLLQGILYHFFFKFLTNPTIPSFLTYRYPGIGKSWFLLYCLYRFAKMNRGYRIVLSTECVCLYYEKYVYH